VSLELAARIGAAARGVPGVADLHGGLFGEIATYQPGERVIGVRLGDAAGEVHIVVDGLRPAHLVGEQVRAIAEKLADMPITVVVADIQWENTR
jgi:hypothetical protein